METMRPRISAGLTSAMYKGDNIEAAPTPIPAIIRQKTSMLCVDAHPINTEDTMKIAAAKMRGSFLPYLSVKYPVKSVPIIQPKYNELPVHPSSALLN